MPAPTSTTATTWSATRPTLRGRLRRPGRRRADRLRRGHGRGRHHQGMRPAPGSTTPEVPQWQPIWASPGRLPRSGWRSTEVGSGAVWVIGCAPTALFELLALPDAQPALVIGLPVGFVGAAESKAALRAVGAARRQQRQREGRLGGRGGGPQRPALHRAGAHEPRPGHRRPRQQDDDGVAEFAELVAWSPSWRDVDVAGGFLELSSPPMTDAVAELYDRGHRRLVAVPLVLVGAGHAKGDVPAALVRERLRRRRTHVRLRPAARAAPCSAGDPRRAHRGGRSAAASGLTPRWCWSAVGPPTPTPTPTSPRPRGCCRRAGASSRSRRRSSPWPQPSVPAALERARLLGARRDRGLAVLPVLRRAARPRGRADPCLGRRHTATVEVRMRGGARAGRADRPAGPRALQRGARRRRPDELRHLHLPHRDAGVRGQGGRSAGAARPPRRPTGAHQHQHHQH